MNRHREPACTEGVHDDPEPISTRVKLARFLPVVPNCEQKLQDSVLDSSIGGGVSISIRFQSCLHAFAQALRGKATAWARLLKTKAGVLNSLHLTVITARVCPKQAALFHVWRHQCRAWTNNNKTETMPNPVVPRLVVGNMSLR